MNRRNSFDLSQLMYPNNTAGDGWASTSVGFNVNLTISFILDKIKYRRFAIPLVVGLFNAIRQQNTIAQKIAQLKIE